MKDLKDAEVVIDDGGILYWYENANAKSYNSDFEATQALDHSKLIVAGLKSALRELVFTDAVGRDMFPKIEYEKHAMTHLKTGYPEVYKDYLELMDLRSQITREEQKFMEDLKAKLLINCPTASSAQDVAKIVLEDTREVLRGHEPSYLINLKVKGGEVESNPFHLAPEEAFESLKNFIVGEEKSAENTRKCSRIVELENNYYALRTRFEEDAKDLILQVENGTPLNGSCDVCPKVRLR